MERTCTEAWPVDGLLPDSLQMKNQTPLQSTYITPSLSFQCFYVNFMRHVQ